MNLTRHQQLEIFKELFAITYSEEDPERAVTKLQNRLAILIARYKNELPKEVPKGKDQVKSVRNKTT